jgi:hypothetical protein
MRALGSQRKLPLEPQIPICDAHHHFWDLRPQFNPYHKYLLPELVADIGSGHNVRSTVFVEARWMYRAAGPEKMRCVGEVEFAQGQVQAVCTAPARRQLLSWDTQIWIWEKRLRRYSTPCRLQVLTGCEESATLYYGIPIQNSKAELNAESYRVMHLGRERGY